MPSGEEGGQNEISCIALQLEMLLTFSKANVYWCSFAGSQ